MHNWLDSLVDVVVNVLTTNGGTSALCVLNITDLAGVLELSTLSLESLSYVVVVSVLNLAVLNSSHVVGVLLWHDLAVLDWLNRGVLE